MTENIEWVLNFRNFLPVASVCNRGSLYGTLDTNAITQQAISVAEHLVSKDGLTEFVGQTSSYVSRVISRIETDLPAGEDLPILSI